MWLVFFIVGIIGMLFLFVHINLELNSLSGKIDTFIAEIKKHYANR